MVKKSVRKRITRRKSVVRKEIVSRLSARDGMMMNRMNGVVPQAVGHTHTLVRLRSLGLRPLGRSATGGYR